MEQDPIKDAEDKVPEDGHSRNWFAGPSNVVIRSLTGSYPVHTSSAATGRPGEPPNVAIDYSRPVPTQGAVPSPSHPERRGSTGRGPHAWPPVTPPSVQKARERTQQTQEEGDGSEDDNEEAMDIPPPPPESSRRPSHPDASSRVPRRTPQQLPRAAAPLPHPRRPRGRRPAGLPAQEPPSQVRRPAPAPLPAYSLPHHHPTAPMPPARPAPCPLNIAPRDPVDGAEVLLRRPAVGIVALAEVMMGTSWENLLITGGPGVWPVTFASYIRRVEHEFGWTLDRVLLVPEEQYDRLGMQIEQQRGELERLRGALSAAAANEERSEETIRQLRAGGVGDSNA